MISFDYSIHTPMRKVTKNRGQNEKNLFFSFAEIKELIAESAETSCLDRGTQNDGKRYFCLKKVIF